MKLLGVFARSHSRLSPLVMGLMSLAIKWLGMLSVFGAWESFTGKTTALIPQRCNNKMLCFWSKPVEPLVISHVPSEVKPPAPPLFCCAVSHVGSFPRPKVLFPLSFAPPLKKNTVGYNLSILRAFDVTQACYFTTLSGRQQRWNHSTTQGCWSPKHFWSLAFLTLQKKMRVRHICDT